MSKHTPGPWYVDDGMVKVKDPSALWGYRIVADAGLVGNVREANARLIAAAPKLLEACKAYIQHRKAFIAANPNRISEADLITLVGRAIAEAEGTDSPGGVK